MNQNFNDTIGATEERYSHASPLGLLWKYLLGNSIFLSIFIFLLLFTLYSELPLPIAEGRIIPGFLLMPFLLLLWTVIKDDIKLKHFYIIFVIFGVALISCLFHISASDPVSIVFRILQFIYSIVCCVFIAVFLSKAQLTIFKNVCLFFVLFIFFGCILERLGIISPIINAFHQLYAGSDYFGDVDEFRDMNISGFVRPLFFTSEPSFVGLGFFAFSSAFIIVNTRILVDFVILFLSFILIGVLGSPTLLLAILFNGILVLIKLRISLWQVIVLLIAIFILISALFQLPIFNDMLLNFITRFADEVFEEGTSIYARIYVPYFKILPEIVRHVPVFGVGYGNHTVLNGLLGYKGELDEWEAQFIRGANAFVNYFSYLGFLGTFIIIMALARFSRIFNPRCAGLVLLFWFLQNQMIGTFSSPRSWGYLAIVVAAFSLAQHQQKHFSAPVSKND